MSEEHAECLRALDYRRTFADGSRRYNIRQGSLPPMLWVSKGRGGYIAVKTMRLGQGILGP